MRVSERIVVFDGVCNLCSRSVRFMLKHDVHGKLRFASAQSAVGRELLERNGIDALDPQTFLLFDGGRVYVRTDAALEIAKDLGGWRWLQVFRVVPRGVRDWLYGLVARNRYRWFGKREACFVPTEEQRARFLDVPSA